MRFSTICTGLLSSTALVAAAPTVEKRALTAAQMVTSINQLTEMSRQLSPVVSNIQTGETAISKRQTNPFEPLFKGFQQINTATQTFASKIDGTEAYSAADATPVCNAFSDYVTVNQELLKVVIGKSGLLEGFFAGPVASVLRTFENSVDGMAFGIIDATPSCDATNLPKKENLDETLGKTVCAYTPGGSLGVDLFC